MSQRLTRKEIKRDEVLETVGSFVGFLQRHGRTLVLGVVGLMLALLVAWGVWMFRERREAAAGERLAVALAAYAAPVDASDPRPDDAARPSFGDDAARKARADELFRAVREEYGGTDAADIAGAYLGGLAAAAGREDEARQHWEEFLDRQGDHLLAAQIQLNLMALDRAQGRSAKLVDRLRARLDDPREKLPKDVLLHQLGLALEELGRPAEARDAYGRLVDEHPESPLRAEAEGRVDALEG